jgi:hypothetical protein
MKTCIVILLDLTTSGLLKPTLRDARAQKREGWADV